jgi:NADPH:quinone reductase-like Zn-dependent oxidoreductase
MPSNSAALLTTRFGDLEVRDAPFPAAGPGQLVLRNRALAVNPLDLIKQTAGNIMYGWLPYPTVLGEDVAGEVVDVGAGVTRFSVGDRAIAYALGMEKRRDHSAEGGFQLYSVVESALAAPIPDTLAFEDAVVLPLAVSTAASALFQEDQLGLRRPTAPRAQGHREWVVVWGGSTSVGSNAVQLAVAAGYGVVATASPHNHEHLLRLGAGHVFDYADPSVIGDISATLHGKHVAGILAVGTGSAEPCVAIAARTGARRVALASPSVSLESLPRIGGFSAHRVATLARLVLRTATLQVRSRLQGIRARFVWGSSLHGNEVGQMLWEDFLPRALADGSYVPAPQALVVGNGLGQVQPALDLLRKGVSARKLVVALP